MLELADCPVEPGAGLTQALVKKPLPGTALPCASASVAQARGELEPIEPIELTVRHAGRR